MICGSAGKAILANTESHGRPQPKIRLCRGWAASAANPISAFERVSRQFVSKAPVQQNKMPLPLVPAVWANERLEFPFVVRQSRRVKGRIFHDHDQSLVRWDFPEAAGLVDQFSPEFRDEGKRLIFICSCLDVIAHFVFLPPAYLACL